MAFSAGLPAERSGGVVAAQDTGELGLAQLQRFGCEIAAGESRRPYTHAERATEIARAREAGNA
jgi:hypothetical protein